MNIDNDIFTNARAYVLKQIETMRKYGSAPELSDTQINDLAIRVAKPAQEIRNWQVRAARKRADALLN